MIVARIAEVLRIESLIVTDGNIGDVALRIANSLVDGIDETFVGREFQTSIAFKDFFVHLGVYLHSVGFNEFARTFIVAFALDALNRGEEIAKEMTHLSIVIDANKGFTFLFHQFHTGFSGLLRLGLFEHPVSNQSAIAHVGFFDSVARFDAHQLGECSVLDITIIGGFVGVHVRSESEFYEFGISQIVEREEVGAGFFDGGTIGLQGVGVGAGKELSAAVSQTFVEVGVEVVATVAIFEYQLTRGFVNDEFFIHSAAVCGFGVS